MAYKLEPLSKKPLGGWVLGAWGAVCGSHVEVRLRVCDLGCSPAWRMAISSSLAARDGSSLAYARRLNSAKQTLPKK